MGKEEVNEVRLGENYQRLLTVEKALDSYFDKYLAPVVDECYEYQEEQRKGEFKERSSAPQLAFMPPAAAMQYAMGGNWCSRHTEDLVEDVMSRLGRDEVMSSDLSHLGKEWRRGMLGMLDASGNHSQANRLVVQDALGNRNFSDAYIRSRITGRIVDRLAAKGVPKDSLDYVVRYGFGDNVATFLFDVHGKSRMDKRVVELSEKKYDPTVLETVAAMGASFLADTAITGGMAAGGAAARTVAGVRTGVRTVKGFKVMEMGVSEAEKKAARYVGRIANAFGVGEVSLQTGALFSGDTASATQEVSR